MSIWEIERQTTNSSPILRWLAFAEKATQLLNIPHLDGNQAIDGYSLDGAHAAFRFGWTPEQYADDARQTIARIAAIHAFRLIANDDGDPHFIPMLGGRA